LFETNTTGTMVTKMKCALCLKFEDTIKYCRNFNKAMIVGVTTVKKDVVKKHLHSEMHKKAMGLNSHPQSVADFFQKTDLGKSMRKGDEAELERVKKLVDIAYVVCKTEKPFTLFPHLCKLEMRHGVKLGTSYHTDKKCAEFASCVAEVWIFVS